MEQYISKSAVVAEINRVLNSYDPNEITSGRYALADLRDFLDTLEVKEVDEPRYNGFMGKELQMVDDEIHRLENLKVKEVDLEKELETLDSLLYDLDGVAVKGATHYLTVEDIKDIAKYFFELGLKAKDQ